MSEAGRRAAALEEFRRSLDDRSGSRKRRRAGRIFLGSLLGLLLLLVAGWWILAERQIRQTLADLRRAGHAASLAELAPPEVPAHDNGAPLYAAAFALFSDSDLEFVDDLDSLEPEERAEVLRSLARYAEAFDLVRRARRFPFRRFNRDYSGGLDVRAPEAGDAVRMGRGLYILAQSHADAGGQSEAQEVARDLAALAEAFAGEPLLLSQWARLELWHTVAMTAARCCRTTSAEGGLRAWRDLLPPASILDNATSLTLKGELAAWTSEVRGGFPFTSVLQWGGTWEQQICFTLLKPSLKMGAAEGLLLLKTKLEIGSGSYLETHEAAVAADAVEPSWSLIRLDPMRYQTPRVEGLLHHRLLVQAAMTVTRTGLEWERAWAAQGAYPERVDAEDPCSGRPLVYRPDQGRLSSIGPRRGFREDDGLVWKLRHAGD